MACADYAMSSKRIYTTVELKNGNLGTDFIVSNSKNNNSL